MQPRYLCLLFALLLAGPARAQDKYLTRSGRVSFFSSSLIEDIEATNLAVAAAFDLATGQLAFSVPIREFQFKRTLMQEHFNENYMESEKYPKATFTGTFGGASAATLGTPGSHPVEVTGELTLHGVTRRVTVTGSLELREGQLLAFAFFSIAPADYNIEVPLLVREHIAKVVRVRVALSCEPALPPPPAARSNGVR